MHGAPEFHSIQFFRKGGPIPIDLKQKVKGDVLAQLFVCDARTIRDLADRGHVVKIGRNLYDLPASIMRLVPHLRDVASGRGGADGVQSLTAERARLAREQADGHAIKNRLARGELIETAAVEARWSDICAQIRSRLLSIPSQLPAELPTITRAELDLIDRLIRQALHGLADELANESDKDD